MIHTPGPWFSVQYGPYFNIQSEPYYDADDNLLNVEDFDRAECNAKLCAAAPELLEALREVVAITDRNHEAWYKAKAAIKKATE